MKIFLDMFEKLLKLGLNGLSEERNHSCPCGLLPLGEHLQHFLCLSGGQVLQPQEEVSGDFPIQCMGQISGLRKFVNQ